MLALLKKQAKMSACDWCFKSLDGKFVYKLHTQINGAAKVFRIGAECCIRTGQHAHFANRYGRPPMFFEIEDLDPPSLRSKRVRSSPVRYTPS